MGHTELYTMWFVIALIGVTTASTCWGVWRLQADLRAFRQHVQGYRDDLD